ncbi:B-cell lymphoma 3 protein homolog [Haemaphysalis longicornis]
MPTAADGSELDVNRDVSSSAPSPLAFANCASIFVVPKKEPCPAVTSDVIDASREKRKKRVHSDDSDGPGAGTTDSGLVCDDSLPPTRDLPSAEESATSDYSSGGSSTEHSEQPASLSSAQMVVRPAREVSPGSSCSAHKPTSIQQALLLKRARRCARQEHRRVLEVKYALLSDADGDRPLHIAVLHDDIALVQRLCRLTRAAGASVDVFNSLRQTPLHLALIVGNQPAVEVLLREGASVLLRDRNGNTALHLALKYPSLPCLRLVLSHHLASKVVDVPDFDGYSPLHLAVLLNKPEVVSLLIKASCDVNVPDGRSGRTPLYHAIALQREHLVKQLVAHGASIDAQDYAGHSCLALAKEAKSPCLPLLQGKASATRS